MDQRTGVKLLKMERKTAKISIRCTEETKRKIAAKAERMETSESRLLEEAVDVILRRRSRYDKGKARTLVETQEAMNHMVRELGNDQSGSREQLLDLMERMAGLWQF